MIKSSLVKSQLQLLLGLMTETRASKPSLPLQTPHPDFQAHHKQTKTEAVFIRYVGVIRARLQQAKGLRHQPG